VYLAARREITVLSLDDPRWQELHGGYKVPYDASSALKRLERGEDVWDELWQELHHQGDLGEASYAAVPQLVRIAEATERRDWNFYALLSCIEVQRHLKTNPPIPDWLEKDYRTAWLRVRQLVAVDLLQAPDALTVRSILGAAALAAGQVKLGAWIAYADESEIEADLEERSGWSESYR
jgi:hypothetical protein